MTNYEKYFGTPERVIETFGNLDGVCVLDAEHPTPCKGCLFRPVGGIKCDQKQLEWLQEECDE